MLALFTLVGKQPWAVALLSGGSGGASRGSDDTALLPALLGLAPQKRAPGEYEHAKARSVCSEEDA
jgi:hypothetical protein